ncbi:hypothetical protein [Acidovorax sp. A1169]
MTVLDREGMQVQACSCYAADKAVYTEMMGVAALKPQGSSPCRVSA